MGNSFFNEYPYTDFHELNLSWVIKELRTFATTLEQFVSINALKYADPIQWDITRQYEKNTIVIDPQSGTAYISVAAVPVGVALTNPDYWTVVFDLEQFVTKANNNFTPRVEENTTLNATFATNAGQWVVWGGELYQALSNIIAGDQYVIDSNIRRLTVEDITGDLPDLTTTDKSNLVAAINEVLTSALSAVNTEKLAREAADGDLSTLTTTDKSNLVAAINEVLTSALNAVNTEKLAREAADGDLSTLTTTDKSNLVAAINEVNSTGGGAIAKIGDLNDLLTTDKSNVVAAINEVVGDISGLNGPQSVLVEYFGAVGNGIVDDTAAIQAALNGAQIIICNNDYRITSSIDVPEGKILIGKGSIKGDYSGGYFDLLTLHGNNIIDGLSFTDTGATFETGYNIIYGDTIQNVSITNCVFSDIHAGYAVQLVHSDHLTINNNKITDYSYAGIMLIDGCQYCDVSYNHVYNARINYYNKYPISLSGYFLEASRPAKYVRCNYNYIEEVTPVWEGIDSHSLENAEIIGNYIANVRSGVVLTSPSTPVLQSGSSVRSINVRDNTIFVAVADGVANGIICSIDDNHGHGPITGVEIANNYIYATGTPSYTTSVVSGIGIRSAAYNIDIRHNEIVGNWNGISLVDSPCVNIDIEHNTLRSSTLAGTAALNLVDLTGINDMIYIANNQITNNVADVIGPVSVIRGLIKYESNRDDGVYTNTDYITTPRSAAPSTATKNKGKAGDFIARNAAGTIAGWLCVAPAVWVSITSATV